MTWEYLTLEQQRKKMISDYQQDLYSMTDLCKQYEISRKTAYKWLERYIIFGEEGLTNLSTAPIHPFKHFTDEQIQLAIDLKLKFRKWGPKKIIIKLQEKYPELKWPSPTRLYEIFKEHHLVTSRKLRQRLAVANPLQNCASCNDTWAVDLKGWFLVGDGQKCEPLTITDCHSRYLIRCTHLPTHTADDVWIVFDESFREYGLPLRVRSDNGPPFGSKGIGRLTSLSVKLIKSGVNPEWIHPGHPEENGRHERFHLTLKQEVATPPKDTLEDQITAMNHFQQQYNFERPHEALNMQTPNICYTSSERKWDGKLRSPEYDTREVEVRKVGQNGCVHVRQTEYYIGQVLAGEYVALKTTEEGREIYFGNVHLGNLDSKGDFNKPLLRGRRRRYA